MSGSSTPAITGMSVAPTPLPTPAVTPSINPRRPSNQFDTTLAIIGEAHTEPARPIRPNCR
jgi:hypothetical protein